MTARTTSSEEFVLLHASRIRGVVPLDAALRLAPPDVVDRLQAEGVLQLGKRGMALTGAGFARHGELLDDLRSECDLDTVAATYERFLSLNVPVKSACADWQHSSRDAEALFVVGDLLVEYASRLQPALRRAAGSAPWLGEYAPRLDEAAARALEGDARYVTDPSVDSFHTIWFECHEDYLVTLGRSREEEGS